MSNFDKAFAKARKGGKSNFSFGGKDYNTKLAPDVPAKKKSSSVKLPDTAPIPTPRPEKPKTNLSSSISPDSQLFATSVADAMNRNSPKKEVAKGPGPMRDMSGEKLYSKSQRSKFLNPTPYKG